MNVSYGAAALAGLLSFLSPCVLPLVPPYLCFMAGSTAEELETGAPGARRAAVLSSLLFVAGFTLVFVALGATASAVGQTLLRYGPYLNVLAGISIAAMGLHFLGVLRFDAMLRERRLQVERPPGLWTAFLIGLAFAFGWTPCIGPLLGAILTMAGAEETALRGASLLAVYSLGLGVPFVAAALATGAFLRFLRGFRTRLASVEKAAGALLVLTGVAFVFRWTEGVSSWLLNTFPSLAALAFI